MRLLIAAHNRSVGIEGGRIVPAEGAFDVMLDAPDAEVRPGLINAHDHLHRNHYGRLGAPSYANARDWALDIQSRHADVIAEGRRTPRRDALLAGAWKNLFAGVTTVVHHDAWEPDFEREFPLRVARIRSADSLAMTPALIRDGTWPFALHVAEGIDAGAAEEVRTLDASGLLSPGLIAVHGVGMDRDAIGRFRAVGAALVWCPTSNLFLLGRTAPAELLAAGVDVLLGSDSLLTGAGDLLDELQCARGLGLLSDERLEQAVGALAAQRLGLPPPSLDPGAPADLALLSKPLLDARAADVLLVIVGGAVRVAATALVPALKAFAAGGREMELRGVRRWTCAADQAVARAEPSAAVRTLT